MTVAIAAIASLERRRMLVMAADRMITAGDSVQFEPLSQKVFPITTSISALVSGDLSWHAHVYRKTVGRVTELLDSMAVARWLDVEEVAHAYRDSYVAFRDSSIEYEVLAPYRITWESFQRDQRSFSPAFVRDLLQATQERIQNFDNGFSALIVGIDDSGAHIFQIDGSKVANLDLVGFAAIGAGATHALSQFQLESYSILRSTDEALLLTYVAKKAAEVAPGVGTMTDMFVAGPNPGTSSVLREDIAKRVIKTYQQRQKDLGKAKARALQSLRQSIATIPSSSPELQNQPSAADMAVTSTTGSYEASQDPAV